MRLRRSRFKLYEGKYFSRPQVQKTQSKTHWRYAASVRMLALPVPRAEYKPQLLPLSPANKGKSTIPF
jgi:hypothetical protein